MSLHFMKKAELVGLLEHMEKADVDQKLQGVKGIEEEYQEYKSAHQALRGFFNQAGSGPAPLLELEQADAVFDDTCRSFIAYMEYLTFDPAQKGQQTQWKSLKKRFFPQGKKIVSLSYQDEVGAASHIRQVAQETDVSTLIQNTEIPRLQNQLNAAAQTIQSLLTQSLPKATNLAPYKELRLAWLSALEVLRDRFDTVLERRVRQGTQTSVEKEQLTIDIFHSLDQTEQKVEERLRAAAKSSLATDATTVAPGTTDAPGVPAAAPPGTVAAPVAPVTTAAPVAPGVVVTTAAPVAPATAMAPVGSSTPKP